MRATETITAKSIAATDRHLTIVLEDRTVRIPWAKCSRILAGATSEQRRSAELSPGGYGIHWPPLDEDLSIGGLLRDHDARGRPVR
jgi:hypothetical protein